jgi:hypothetical protein
MSFIQGIRNDLEYVFELVNEKKIVSAVDKTVQAIIKNAHQNLLYAEAKLAVVEVDVLKELAKVAPASLKTKIEAAIAICETQETKLQAEAAPKSAAPVAAPAPAPAPVVDVTNPIATPTD